MLPLDTLSKNPFFFSLTCDNHWKILGMTWFNVASLQPLSPLSHGPLNCVFTCSVSFSLQRHWSLDLGPTSTQYNPVLVLSSKSYQSNYLILCLALNLSQHQGLFQWISSLHQAAKILELQLQQQSFQWILRVNFLSDSLAWSCCPRDSQKSSPAQLHGK